MLHYLPKCHRLINPPNIKIRTFSEKYDECYSSFYSYPRHDNDSQDIENQDVFRDFYTFVAHHTHHVYVEEHSSLVEVFSFLGVDVRQPPSLSF